MKATNIAEKNTCLRLWFQLGTGSPVPVVLVIIWPMKRDCRKPDHEQSKVACMIACRKTGSSEQNTVQHLSPGKILPVTFVQKNHQQNKAAPDEFEDGQGLGCHCPVGSSAVMSQIVWYLATCRSNCTRGIGFRCGREGFIVCSDGTTVYCFRGSNCPNNTGSSSRKMKASYTFYDNGTIKLTFLNPVPEDERGNTVFEVEESEMVPFPEAMQIGGNTYSGYLTQQGNYYIDYSDGQYGSVIINAVLKP
jgi:hypothetical protein